MKKTVIFITMAIIAFASCTKESMTNPEVASEKFTAAIDQEISTKTTLGEDGLSVLWETGDSISINGCKYIADKSGERSPFTPAGTEATANDNSPAYTAIYPAGLSDNVLPDVQNYKEGSFKCMPMYATSDTRDLEFKNICAVLAITVPSSITKVRSIEVSSSNKALSGAFTISSDNVLELKDSTNFTNTMTLECGLGVANPGIFYIAIPAGTYQNLKITVCDGSYIYMMTTKSGKDIKVERNKKYPITFKTQEKAENCFRFTALTGGCHLQTNSWLTDESRDRLYNDPNQDESPQQDIISFQYSKDGGKNWTDAGSFISLDLNKGEVVCIKSVAAVNGFNDWGMDYECMPSPAANVFSITSGSMKVSGDLISALNRSDKFDRSVGGNDTWGASGHAFAFLFDGSGDHLVSARDLILPETTAYRCYYSMFAGCTALKEAPIMPAETLASDCYKSMFSGCSSLKSVTMLATSCPGSNWLENAGTSATNPILYYNPEVTSDTKSAIQSTASNFTLKPFNQ